MNTKTEEMRARMEEHKTAPRSPLPDLLMVHHLIPSLLSYDEATMTMELAFDTLPWMAIPNGVVHGGIVASMIDNAMGMVSFIQKEFPNPTVSMNVNYIRPVPVNTTVVVRTRVLSYGKSSAHITAELFHPDRPDHILISATGVYYSLLANSKP